MNEKIRELAINSELAELYDRYVDYCMKNGDDDILDYGAVVGKFAELIVKDCIDEIQRHKDGAGLAELICAGLNYSQCVIKKHFGVEE
jgi:hypothetical protein